jgi:beta-lactam-binding protein with PASTA domain
MANVGRVFANRYELRTVVGHGGMADVYLARDRLLNRRVAVKVLSPTFAADPTFVERFRREAQAAASLNHPNIVAVYDWGQSDDTSFIVMEYVNGQTLGELINRYGTVPAMEAARIAADIADALEFAHRNGVVHRDVKPGNVLITPEGGVKVTDFGIARAESSDTLTKTGAVLGTATYFSPEQAQGLALDGRSDVYALGVVLYEMLTGIAPFTADSPVSVAYKHVREEPVPPTRVKPGIPGALDRIVLTAMTKDVALRYPSAAEMRADLLRFERGRPLHGGPLPGAVQTAAVVAAPVAAGTTGGGGGAVDTPLPSPSPARAPVPPPRKRRRWGAAVFVSILFGALIALIVTLLVQSDFGDSGNQLPLLDVPKVTNELFPTAEAALVNEGFKVVRADTESTLPPDTVLTQDPEAGLRLRKGGTITLTVSSATVALPDIVGKTRAEATALLSVKSILGDFVEEDAPDHPPGTVLRTDPAAGALIQKSFPFVKVIVAKAPQVAVPDVSNLDAVAASAAIQNAGLRVAPTSRPTASDNIPVGRIVGTDPSSGTMLPRDSEVTLLISTGPQLVDVPNTVGKTRAEAEGILTGARFSVRVSFRMVPAPQQGLVIEQSPADGQAAPLSFVTITVGI